MCIIQNHEYLWIKKRKTPLFTILKGLSDKLNLFFTSYALKVNLSFLLARPKRRQNLKGNPPYDRDRIFPEIKLKIRQIVRTFLNISGSIGMKIRWQIYGLSLTNSVKNNHNKASSESHEYCKLSLISSWIIQLRKGF